MQILLVWVSDHEGKEWVNSFWAEDKQEAAIERAMQFRDEGFDSAVVAYNVDRYDAIDDTWDEESQKIILRWKQHY